MGRLGRRRATAGVVALACGLTLALLVLTLAGCTSRSKRHRSLEGVPVVRVRVLEGQPRASITAPAGGTLSLGSANQSIAAGVTLTVERSAEGGWHFRASKGQSFTATLGEVTVTSSDDDQFLRANGQPYRGKLRLVASGTGKVDVVNDV